MTPPPGVPDRPHRHPDPVARATGLAWLHLVRPDLDSSAAFFEDLGLVVVERTDDEVLLRTAAAAPFAVRLTRSRRASLGGVALDVDEADLERLAAVPGARAVRDLALPGGGRAVDLSPPGPTPWVVTAVAGRVARATTGPATGDASSVLGLGHAVIESPRMVAILDWLLATFGFLVSDYQYLATRPGAGPIVAFLRLDLGAELSDHHTLALGSGIDDGLAHAAFEVESPAAVRDGGSRMLARGRPHVWGVGRHILGDQVFDYWRDPDGSVFELYAEGDRFDSTVLPSWAPFDRHAQHRWGPPMPDDFIDASLSPSNLASLVRGLVRGELDPRTLVAARRALTA